MGTGVAPLALPSPLLSLTCCAGFDELVEEYTRLVERLEDRQWTMKVGCDS
jgi:hypothetical protein